jgi:hypothetical protein
MFLFMMFPFALFLATAKSDDPHLPMPLWCIVMGQILALCGLLYAFLWHWKGLEIVSVNQLSLSIDRRLFRWAKRTEFDLAGVRNLRAAPKIYNIREMSAFENGDIAFDFADQTYRFGAGLGADEAEELVCIINRRLPALDVQSQTNR